MGGIKMGNSIYRDIAERTKGSVYIGVIGPVRRGNSTGSFEERDYGGIGYRGKACT